MVLISNEHMFLLINYLHYSMELLIRSLGSERANLIYLLIIMLLYFCSNFYILYYFKHIIYLYLYIHLISLLLHYVPDILISRIIHLYLHIQDYKHYYLSFCSLLYKYNKKINFIIYQYTNLPY